jgi:uncharacterized membrane protein
MDRLGNRWLLVAAIVVAVVLVVSIGSWIIWAGLSSGARY